MTTDVKEALHLHLQASRKVLLSKLDGLGEYDLRRPMTSTGTNLLGLVKHLAGIEYEYLGDALHRPPPETLSWVEDGSVWDGADMWAAADESSAAIVALYRRACTHGDATIAALDLDAPGFVEHWPPERRHTTLGVLLVRMVAETAQHAGHADILRESIDATAGADHDEVRAAEWSEYVARVQAAADAFRGPVPAGGGSLEAQRELAALKAHPYEDDPDLNWEVPLGPDLPYDGNLPDDVIALAASRRAKR